MNRRPILNLLFALLSLARVAFGQTALPDQNPPAPVVSAPVQSDVDVLHELFLRLQTVAADGSLDVQAKKSEARDVIAVLGPLAAKYPDAVEFHVVHGYAALFAEDEAAGRKAAATIVRLGGDRLAKPGISRVLTAMRDAGWLTDEAVSPSPDVFEASNDPGIARRSARKALLDGLRALPRDDTNRASLESLTAMVDRAVVADRTLTRAQERALTLLVKQLEQATDEQAMAAKQVELLSALTNALATAPENARHWAMTVHLVRALPDHQTLTLDLGKQQTITVTVEMLVRGGVACLELLGAENSEEIAVLDELIAGQARVKELDKAARKAEIARVEREAQEKMRLEVEAERRRQKEQRDATLPTMRLNPWPSDISVGPVRNIEWHARSVRATYSPDGRYILTASQDGTAVLWDAASGERLHTFSGHINSVNSAVFSPDGNLIVTTSNDNTAIIWDVASRKKSRVLDLHRKPVRSAVFSSDGRLLVTASDDRTAIIWDVSNGACIRRLALHQERLHSAAFSPDDRFVLTTTAYDHGKALLWNAESGQQVRSMPGVFSHTDHSGMDNRYCYYSVVCAAFSPDGLFILIGSGRSGLLYVVNSGELSRKFTGHLRDVAAVAFSSDGRLIVTASLDGNVIVSDVQSGREVRKFSTGQDLSSATFSPDGRFMLIGSARGTVTVWGAIE